MSDYQIFGVAVYLLGLLGICLLHGWKTALATNLVVVGFWIMTPHA